MGKGSRDKVWEMQDSKLQLRCSHALTYCRGVQSCFFFPDLMAHLRCMVSSHVQSSNAEKHVEASGLWKDSYPTIKRLKYIAATSAMQSYPLTSYKTVHVITHHLCDPSQWIIPPSQWSACGATWECSWANPTIGLQNMASVVLQCINYNDWCIHIHNLQ